MSNLGCVILFIVSALSLVLNIIFYLHIKQENVEHLFKLANKFGYKVQKKHE